jgi:hypothetical protein
MTASLCSERRGRVFLPLPRKRKKLLFRIFQAVAIHKAALVTYADPS